MDLERLSSASGVEIAHAKSSTMQDADLAGLAPIVAASIEEYKVAMLFGKHVVFVKPRRELRAATVAKVLEGVSAETSLYALAYYDILSKHMRSSLMKASVPYACSDGQFFIPQALFLLPAKEDSVRQTPRKLSPSSQLVFLWWLYSSGEGSAVDVANSLGISKSSALRGCDALHDLGLLAKRMGGPKMRTSLYRVIDFADFARNGEKLFGDPVKEDLYIPRSDAQGLAACGESALSQQSMLVAPAVPLYAASPEEGSELRRLSISSNASCDGARVRVLSYDPRPFSRDGVVDPFTMLKTMVSDDERVRLSLAEALEGCPWYEYQE